MSGRDTFPYELEISLLPEGLHSKLLWDVLASLSPFSSSIRVSELFIAFQVLQLSMDLHPLNQDPESSMDLVTKILLLVFYLGCT